MADEIIMRDPSVLAGKPVIRGTRISVEFVLGLLADGWSAEDILDSYPHLSKEQIAACLHYARDLLQSENMSPAA
ncbi:MAG: DUF433 domain-containing protein [Bradyrhizobiaceae bacterium]|jgi:uncharacterized protein (DUF433 family)|nr:MAG: DUF433 domain-containing protein [Bradyrhizobiaceae bacterium]